MSEDERVGRIIAATVVLVALIICGTIVICNWRANDATGPRDKLKNDRKIEEVRACAKAADVTSCIRSVEGY